MYHINYLRRHRRMNVTKAEVAWMVIDSICRQEVHKTLESAKAKHLLIMGVDGQSCSLVSDAHHENIVEMSWPADVE